MHASNSIQMASTASCALHTSATVVALRCGSFMENSNIILLDSPPFSTHAYRLLRSSPTCCRHRKNDANPPQFIAHKCAFNARGCSLCHTSGGKVCRFLFKCYFAHIAMFLMLTIFCDHTNNEFTCEYVHSCVLRDCNNDIYIC